MKDVVASDKPRRQIKTFVLRTGRMTEGQRLAYERLWAHWGVEYQASPVALDSLFSNGQPVIFEIGFGMGHSLVSMAEQNPDTNYLGVEVHTPGVGRLLNEVDRLRLTNVRCYRHDALEVLNHCIVDNSLAGVLLFFPDPWHKKRHHKRRMVQPSFAHLIHKKLVPGGFLHLATDWQDYAAQMLSVMDQASGFRNSAGKGNYSPRPDSRPLTKFEKRGQRLGHGVWDLLYHKTT